MLRHAISVIAAGVMIALSVFFALRPHQDNKGIRPSNSRSMGITCQSAPDNDLIPLEQTCERP
jgi:hypothetical protein